MKAKKAITNWLENFIIKHEICPYALAPFEDGLIEIKVCSYMSEKEILRSFLDMLDDFQSDLAPGKTLLWAVPEFHGAFADFHELKCQMDDLIEELGLSEEFQLVAFHPQFKFQNIDEQDVIHHVNRSPVPLIHFLQFRDVTEASQSSLRPADVIASNKAKMKKLFK